MSQLDAKLREIRELGVEADLAARIGRYVREAPPPALVKISPFRLAAEWGTPLGATLRAFLLGTRQGIFDLEWDVRCPSCQGSTQKVDRLVVLRPASHCNYCRIDITGGFDDGVEVTFRVNPDVRAYEMPSLKEVIMARTEMEAPRPLPEGAELALTLAPGTWHVFPPDFSVGAPFRVHGNAPTGPSEARLRFEGGCLSVEPSDVAAGDLRLRRDPSTAHLTGLLLARQKELPFVSGAMVACHQDFRDLFGDELIAPGETFSIRSLAFLFTDIRGSTELYERRGDAKAYALVRDHFQIITDLVRAHDGAIVKTIGDAVMATFTRSDQAVDTVLAMHEAFDHFNAHEHVVDDVIVKVGLHRGPCLAVTSNDKLDYFGRTVNVAARVQGLSKGGDVVLSRSLAEEPSVAERLTRSGWRREAFQASLKGIAEAYEVVRLAPSA